MKYRCPDQRKHAVDHQCDIRDHPRPPYTLQKSHSAEAANCLMYLGADSPLTEDVRGEKHRACFISIISRCQRGTAAAFTSYPIENTCTLGQQLLSLMYKRKK